MKSNRLSTRSSVRSSGTQFQRKAVALGVAMAIASSAYANPTGMSVVAGQATAQTIGNLMQITNTPGAILNWQQFNIDVGQTTQFIQQNTASQVFNRVTGGDISQILGTLQSNGQVFLINPAGVFFGQGAVVDTAGFLASTLAASNTDLLNGHLRFNDSTGTAGNIVNQGSLTTHSGGSIVLLAPSIENSGIIHADGEVLLAAGHSVTIVDMRHPTFGLTVAAKEGDKVLNLGQIISKNASLFSHLVKNSGVVEATGAQVGEGGVIRFIAQGDALVGGQHHGQRTVPDVLVGGIIERAETRYPGIVHQNVDSAKVRCDLRDGADDGVSIRHIERIGTCRRPTLRCHCGAGSQVEVDHCHMRGVWRVKRSTENTQTLDGCMTGRGVQGQIQTQALGTKK